MNVHAVTLLLVLFSFTHSFGQTNPALYKVKLDSLQSLIDRQPKDDTLKVRRLIYLARISFYDLQYKRGLIATVQARQLARKLRYAKGEAMYWRAMYTFSQSNWLSNYYDTQADWFYADRGQTEEYSQLGVNPPAFYDSRSRELKLELEECLSHFAKQPDKEITANILMQYAGTEDASRFSETVSKAISLFQQNKQEEPVFYCLATKMWLLEQRRNGKESKSVENVLTTMIAQTKSGREAAARSFCLGSMYENLKRKAAGFEYYQKADQVLEQLNEKTLRLYVLRRLGLLCQNLGLAKKGVDYFKKEAALREQTKDKGPLIYMYHKIVFTLIELKAYDEARAYLNKAEATSDKDAPFATQLENKAQRYDATGQMLLGEGKYNEAIKNFNQVLEYANRLKTYSPSSGALLDYFAQYYIAQCYQKLYNVSESIRYGKLSYDLASQWGQYSEAQTVRRKASLLLAEQYDKAKQRLEAYKYLKIHQELQNEMEQKEATNQLMDLEVQSVVKKEEEEKNRLKGVQLLQQQRILAIEKQQEIEQLKAQSANRDLQSRAEQAELGRQLDKQRLEAKAQQDKRQQDYQISLLNLDIDNQRKIRTGLLAGLGIFALFAGLLFRQNQAKQRLNKTLTDQKTEIEEQRNQLDQSLTSLKNTQAQLIQKEKLASLGELTSGVAHEIQNPLNFVNNFSEVSADLVKEIKEEREKGNQRDEELELELLDDLSLNLQKINHHGGRAASIVRGMLEHSRVDSGERRPTDLSALTKEYLNIAHHGQQAKDKSFRCHLETTFATDLPQIEVATQEIGRVLLNLYNNAFYAVRERQKKGGEGYQPTIWVGTQRVGDTVEIRVRDNGTGIPESVKAKIFQPFFTTKPTGEGTGLGLSLSYDIITKGHGGTLRADSEEGKGTEFVVALKS